MASYYDLSGNVTALGDVLTQSSWTAAHRTLPFGTEITVCHHGVCAHNVVINDRGPYIAGRDLDVHVAVANTIGPKGVGVDYVRFYIEHAGQWDDVRVSHTGPLH